jgi:hypothetical protein
LLLQNYQQIQYIRIRFLSVAQSANSFSADAPNDAIIVANKQSGHLETAIVASFAPIYDIATNSLTYTITTENATSIELPREFGQTVLVVDQENFPVFWLAQTVSRFHGK